MSPPTTSQEAAALYDPLQMDLTHSTLALLAHIDTLAQPDSSTPAILAPCLLPTQRQLLERFANPQEELTTAEINQSLTIVSTLLKNEHVCLKVVELYRPLVLDLVARWLIPDHGDSTPSSPDNQAMEVDEPTVQSTGTPLDLENMAVALGIILPIVPQVTTFAVRLFSRYPSPLEWINGLTEQTLQSPSKDTTLKAHRILITVFRLLSFSHHTFSPLWDWTPLYTLLNYNDNGIKYLTLRCLAMVLDIRDDQFETAIKAHLPQDVDVEIITSNIRFKADLLSLVEQDRISAAQLALFRNPGSSNSDSNYRRISSNHLSPLTVNLCGVLLPRSEHHGSNISAHQLVLTETTKHNLHSIGLALSIGAPVLLEGVTGAGKTALVEEVARITGRDDLVKIHLGDQTDSKVLLGTYVSTSTPGSFRWQAGVLTTAVREGRWLLIEDIDLAPMEVLSVLLPLLESRTLFIPSRGEKIPAKEGFQLFATKSMIPSRSGRMMSRSTGGTDASIGNNLWTKVQVNSLSHSELSEIIHKRFHNLDNSILPELIMTVFENLVAIFASQDFAHSQSMVSRVISPRDLMKWCTRIDMLIEAKGGYEALSYMISRERGIDELILQDLFSEAVDCFCSMIAEYDVWKEVLVRLGRALTLSSEKINWYIDNYTPKIDVRDRDVAIGRVTLPVLNAGQELALRRSKRNPFAMTAHAKRLLEKIAVSVHLNEPVLLVGETGTGKTTVVQYLAHLLHHELTVINLSQQSDSSDLLGGFKPVDVKVLAVPLKDKFESLFPRTFAAKRNKEFLDRVHKMYSKGQWGKLIDVWTETVSKAEIMLNKPPKDGNQSGSKRVSPKLRQEWQEFADKVAELKTTYSTAAAKFVFSFMEGSLVQAVRRGDWILLDEINLATTETLECLSGLLQDAQGSLLLAERGDSEPVPRHPNFRVFACMNPATDVGKKDLPPGLRNRFTEFYVHPPDARPDDLLEIVKGYLKDVVSHSEQGAFADIVDFYLEVKGKTNRHELADGAGQRPHFSMRTLTRALQFVREIVSTYGLRRAMYEAFSMTFLTQLNKDSERAVRALVEKHLLKGVKNPRTLITHIPRRPNTEEELLQFDHYWLKCGRYPPVDVGQYILTPSVRANLNNLARVVMTQRFPILIQGPTSAGKTSMIEYLANRLGHKFVRINNHEHTDLQEYLGTYISNSEGQLVFQEGVLVEALRNGWWIVLDELNLAPSDVLEALNRLLDDNRELLIPETGDIVRPHPDFMLFATQNPAGLYGGRKQLSRAFRNRFLELFFDDIPQDELAEILSKRCSLPDSRSVLLVEVYKGLMRRRQTTRIFEQGRGSIDKTELAMDGYMILAERCRKDEEREVVKEVLEEVFKCKLDIEAMYESAEVHDYIQKFHGGRENVVWTRAMKRLFTLVSRCLKFKEPVLLVGETGCGKTTVCQMLAEYLNQELVIVNCHQNTETADLLGGQRPVRNKQGVVEQTKRDLVAFIQKVGGEIDFIPEEADLNVAVQGFENCVRAKQLEQQDDELKSTILQLRQQYRQALTLFEWHDGPLVQSLKEGHLFLLDEISLADDSVLERLNSVLEPHRLLVLAEKGGKTVEVMYGVDKFQFLATMNPGGDYGKKELSPALRNRFTEIWVPAVTDRQDLIKIIEEQIKFPNEMAGFAARILDFVAWYADELGKSRVVVSLRDILAWVRFMNELVAKGGLSAEQAFVHGGSLVLLDGLGSNASAGGASLSGDLLREFRLRALAVLSGRDRIVNVDDVFSDGTGLVKNEETTFGIQPFFIPKGSIKDQKIKFTLLAPTTTNNAMRVLRALQLRKPILLEGSPGVGKTSLISALATASGHHLVRINLSEQTDLMDLFGSDLPVEGGNSGEFAWRDAPFLQAMQSGDWVLLDEINLASQSVLEGLNSCLDHRGAVYIPELDKEFFCHKDFRVFAAQNPLQQGGGRKGLPKSFVNRFTQVFVEQLSDGDILFICKHLFPQVEDGTLRKMIDFNYQMYEETMVNHSFGRKGSPWEFNLRDVFRWMELMTLPDHGLGYTHDPAEHLDLIYLQRMRTEEDRKATIELFEKVFGQPYERKLTPFYHIDTHHLQVGHSLLPRRHADTSGVLGKDMHLLQSFMKPLEGLMKCVEVNWMAILTGPSSSGKTSLVRLLANLTGNKLEEFSMNSGVDTMELLGGFEQVDLARHQEQVLLGLSRLTSQISRELVVMANPEQLKTLAYVREISQSLYLLNSQDKFSKRSSSALEVNKDNERVMRNNAIDGLLGQLRYLVQGFSLVDYEQDIVELEQKFTILKNLEESSVSGRFEWIDGSLINALEHGYWLLIDNANLANPSVLDRLNSLMEPNGTLMVNERGLVDGEVKIIRPHKNFRIFMTVDPKYGELSRAMRNRGVEITLVDAEWIDNAKDVVKITNSLGLRGSGAPDLIHQIHHYLQLYFKATQPWKHLSAKDMLLFSRFAAERLQRGEPLSLALRHCVRQVYSVNESGVATEYSDGGMPVDAELLPEEPPSFDFHLTTENSVSPTNCPHLVDGRLLTSDSQLSTVSMHGSYLMYLLLTEAPAASIWTAAHFFLETCSSEDASLRTKWVEYLLSTRAMEDATRSQTIMVQHILGQLVESPLMSHLTKLKASLASHLNLNAKLMSSQPADMRMNPDLFWAIDQLCKENQAGAAIWAEYQAAARLMALFIRVQKMDYHEQRVYAKARGKKPNTVQVSYLFNQQMWDKPLQHPVVAQISPCLMAVKDISTQWIKALKGLSQEQAELFHLFLDKRDMIWETVQEPSVNVGELMILVKMMGEAVEALDRTSDGYFANFLKSLSAMTDAMVLTSGTLMKSLWRRLHPSVLATQELVELEQELLQIASKADVWSDDALLDKDVLAKARALASIPDFKNTVIEAIATLYFADQSPEKVAALVKTIQQVPAHLQKKVDGVQQQLPGFPKVATSDIQAAVEHLYPIMDFASSVNELALLAKLQQVLAGDLTVGPAALEELQALYTFSLNKSTRSAADFVPHKRLIWAMESLKDGGEDNKAIIRRLAQEVAHSWHARLWQNAFKNTKFDSFAGKLPEENAIEIAAIESPAKLFQSVNTMSYFNYLTTLPKAAVSTLDKQLEQTRTLTTHQVFTYNRLNRVAASLVNLIAAVTMVLDVIVQVHTDVDVSQQVLALTSVSKTLMTGSRQSQDFETALAVLSQFPEQLGSLKPTSASKHLRLSVQHLVRSIQLYQVIGDNEIQLEAEHGKAWIYLGLGFIELYVPDYSLDPTAKPRLMLHALRHKQEQLRSELKVRREIEQTLTGADKNAVIEERLAELAKIEQAIENFATDVALRPAKTLLEEMFKQIWQIQKAAVNTETIKNLMETIESKNGAQHDQERLFQDITQEFIRRNIKKFRSYLDILQPLVVAVYQVKYGVRLVAAANAMDDQKDRDALESIVTCLVRVPDYHVSNSDRMDSVHVVTQPASLEVVRRTVFDNSQVAKKWSFYLKYLITALQHQRSAISSRGIINMADLETLDLLFTEVQEIWAKGKEHAAQVAAENESLYKTRVKKHEGVDDDAIDEAAFREMFPDFDEEFKSTDDNEQDEEKEDKKPVGVPEVEEKTFEDKDITLIGKLHRAVFEHLSPRQCSENSILPDQERRSRIWSWYNRASELADVSNCTFGHQLDMTSQGTHMLASALMEEWLLGRDNQYWSSEPTYDFYKDQNVAEAGRIVPILQKFRIRLKDILSVWTEHAVLESLIQLCDKLLSFPLDSPVAKLLAGIEALLQKTEDWESVASREYSIKDNQNDLTSLIVSWRQLELTCWPKLLETQDRNVAEEVYTWWFDYYGSILKPTREMDMAVDQGIKVDNVTAHIKDLLGVVDQFLQASTIGDFRPRMNLLKSFQRHLQMRGELVMLERKRRFKAGQIAKIEPSVSSQVADALWNVHQYYLQFMDKVESTVQMLRKPIEKDLKEHVKIATWKDVNIHALKASALKTHRRLNKLLKKYRDVLRQPLTDMINAYKLETPIVVAGKGKALDTVIQPSPKIWVADVAVDQTKASEKLLNLVEQQLQAAGTTTDALLNLSKTFDRLKRFVTRDIVLSTPEEEPLEELCGDIIQQIEDFQKETPSKMTEENKSQLKNMKLIRKRALVDLLKLLQRLGLNRHRMVRLEEDLLGYVFHLPPAQVDDLQEQAKKSDKVIPAAKQVAQLWKKSDDYFYRIIARMIYLRELSHQPPKDITVVEAEKGRGYTEHLVHMVIEQRQELQSMKRLMDSLRGVASQLEIVFQLPSESTVTLQSNISQKLLQHKQSVDKLMDLASDAMLVFDVAVRQSTLTTRSQVQKEVRDSLTKLRSLKASVDRLVNRWYLTPQVIGNISPIFANATLDELQQSIRAVFDIEKTLKHAVDQMPETSFIWEPVLCQISEAFSTFGLDRLSLTLGAEEKELMTSLQQNPALSQLLQDIQAEINGCVTTILVSIQDTRSFIAKKKAEAEASAGSNVDETSMDIVDDAPSATAATGADAEEEKDEYGMPEKYIITESKKYAALNKRLRLESIINKTQSISDKIQLLVQHFANSSVHQQQQGLSQPSVSSEQATSEALVTLALQRLYPFIHQLLFLAQHHLFHYVQHHKAITKLTYVLCNTFTTLFSKGFCIPEMEQETKEGEEETNVSGTGIGEGDGGKDVSDEIEDEEQVLGTQNDKKQDENDQKDTEEEDKGIEMENDFDGKLEDVKPTSDDEDDQDDDEDEEEQEDPDEEIGDVDDDNPEAIDEKMWGDDEAEDARDNDKMIDEDKSTEQKEQESDMVAKDEEDQGKPDKKDKKQKKEQSNSADQTEDQEAEEGGDEERPDQEPEEDEGAEEEEFEDHNDEENAEHNPESDQQNVEIPEAETLELPEDLNLDGDENEKEGEDEGPEEEPFEDQMDVEEQPKSKDKKGEDEDSDGEEEEKEDDDTKIEDQAQDSTMDGAEPEDQEDVDMEEPSLENEEEEGEKEGEEEEDNEEEDMRDDSRQRPMDDARAHQEQVEEENQEDEEGEDDDVEASKQEEQPDNDAQAQQEFGVEGLEGKASAHDNAQDEADKEQSRQSAPSASKSDPKMDDQQRMDQPQQRPQNRGEDDSQKEAMSSMEQEQQEKPKKQEVNPHRSLAEALKNWRQKLQDVADPEEEEEEEAKAEADQKEKEEQAKDEKEDDEGEAEQMQVDENQEFEYLQNDDESHDMETMGNATEEQMKENQQKQAAIDEEKMKEDDVADMDVDSKEEEEAKQDQGAEEEKPELNEDVMDETKPENAGGAFFSQRLNKDKKKDDEEDDENIDPEHKRKAKSEEEEHHERLRPEEMERIRHELELELENWSDKRKDAKEAQALWQKYDNLTQDLALGLCEQLRLILEPTLATKLKGDYRTGKRLNMKKIIPYIASQFKKDKIWLRRTKPSKRQYQVMIAIDDSTSMKESQSIQLAYESLALISKALSQLEVGEIGIMSFGERSRLVHSFDQPFTGDAGAKVLQQFGFDQVRTDVRQLMEASIAHLQQAKMNQSGGGSHELWQLEIIISDGICDNHDVLKALVRQAAEQQIMLIFIILDNKPTKDSIMEMQKTSFKMVDGKFKLQLDRYLDSFPFDYYVVLQDIHSLPETLADALRQYFSFVAS
ncbi:AAA ATPase midasin [Actinomortierella wolfii]|nr:AAA ATPase midasin [Actinomortierella wolfii]